MGDSVSIVCTIKQVSDFLLKHKGESACILGNGPSLLNYDLEALAKKHLMIGINKSWTLVSSHYHTFVAREHYGDLAAGKFSPGRLSDDGKTFEPGVVFTTGGCTGEGRARWLEEWGGELVSIAPARRFGDQVWWSADMSKGYHSSWGGAFAIEVAAWMGCNPIWLLGYDAHNLEGHHWDDNKFQAHGQRGRQIQFLKPVAAYLEELGIKAYNANEKSAIPWFEFAQPSV